ncbi:MAG: mechanosensitive ion channel family protein [Spirochaetaceae bacterium]|nr:mechanosensitive ion channel family protein [Spirochaetaceae bacterium]
MNLFENISFEKLIEKVNPPLILKIVIIFFIGFILIRVVRFILKKILSRTMNKQSLMLVNKFFSYAAYSVLVIVIMAEMGIELTAILGAAGILGLAIGVASQKSLGNIISGLFLVAEKSFEIGDVIRVGDKIGVVYSIDFLAIMLKTFDNLLIRIPNETLISAEIVNITKFPIRRLDFSLSVSYKDDLEKVLDLLKRIAFENVLCLDEPLPFLLLKEFGDSGISIQFGVWFEKSNYVDVRNSIILEIKRRFDEENITIPFPHVTLYYGDKESS